MAMPPIAVSGHGMKITPAIEKYINKKLSKNEGLMSAATSISAVCVEEKASRGIDHDFRVEISVVLPRAVARIEKSGADIYAVIDEVSDVILRKMKRYKEMRHQWEGKRPWKIENLEHIEEGDMDEENDVDYVHYVPKIVERLKLENCTPMSEAEAIEQMELADLPCFLFKKQDTGMFSMVYKRKRGGYAIVEPRA